MRPAGTRPGKKWFATLLAVLLVRHPPVLTHRRTYPGNGQLPQRGSGETGSSSSGSRRRLLTGFVRPVTDGRDGPDSPGRGLDPSADLLVVAHDALGCGQAECR